MTSRITRYVLGYFAAATASAITLVPEISVSTYFSSERIGVVVRKLGLGRVSALCKSPEEKEGQERGGDVPKGVMAGTRERRVERRRKGRRRRLRFILVVVGCISWERWWGLVGEWESVEVVVVCVCVNAGGRWRKRTSE